MEYSNIIEMDIWSNFGCFTKPFSNTGGLLTYMIPPKTSIIGIIGAILGYEFDDYEENSEGYRKYKIEELYTIKISIQPLFDLKSKRVTFNYGYGNEKGLKNIKQDVLIKPYYKLYISFPDSLKDNENLFLERIKNNLTIYSLYMGRNEFILNYKYKKTFSANNYILTNDNQKDFFKEKPKIYGSLNRENVKKTKLSSEPIGEIYNHDRKKNSYRLKSFYEYVIKEFPVIRKNFTDFEYFTISFYSSIKDGDCYFSKIELEENSTLELLNIGENKWISMI
ncbi:CRISPR-associated protein Cas5 [Methanobrevibacter cuticularis]|uniref:CRISPR-associated protein Cas5 n=1 Tax=Methanobrevibacter cuticularis TaxID=47311 RepID=A0A166ETN9_9EURY|nr:CRISPR-associated protein Cas5 [Methanobrevibacter cuticularis]KZX17000.1 CRISPR-associated protein Cas5 [Methanobrevibacter cuticularis]